MNEIAPGHFLEGDQDWAISLSDCDVMGYVLGDDIFKNIRGMSLVWEVSESQI